MKILITGATGFIGRPLCLKLTTAGYAVRAAVWRNDPAPVLPESVDKVIIDSIGPDTEWVSSFKDVDTVIHLAARVHVMDETEEEPLAAYRLVNVQGTEKLARAAAAAGVKRFVFLSSVKVNGEETPASYKENSTPAPQDPYGVSKLEAEQALLKISAETGLEVAVIRPPLVYGPGVKANFYKLMRTVARGVPLPLACVKNSRSMVYLGNLLDAIKTCAEHPAAAGKVFFVSDGEDVSIPELVRRIAAALGHPARLVWVPAWLMRIAGKLTGKTSAVDRLFGSLTVDITRIRTELGWTPLFTMAEGLKDTAEWYKRSAGKPI